MKIDVVSAIGDKKIKLDVSPLDSFGSIRKKVAEKLRIPADSFVLVFKGIERDDDSTLKKAGVIEGDKIYVLVRTEGGLSKWKYLLRIMLP